MDRLLAKTPGQIVAFVEGTDPDRYLTIGIELMESGVMRRGRVYDTVISHDDDCPTLVDGSPCTCRPNITIRDITDGIPR